VSTLWTPGGEHEVGKEDPAPRTQPTGSASAFDELEEPELTEEEEDRLAEFEDRLAATPASVIVAQHAYGLFELAALHLGRRPPNLEEARTAIDAMGALVEGMGDRLGEHAGQLAEGLTQLRLTFVKVAEVFENPPG
jgi:hypothetical protein